MIDRTDHDWGVRLLTEVDSVVAELTPKKKATKKVAKKKAKKKG